MTKKNKIQAGDSRQYGHYLNNGERAALSIFEVGKAAGLSVSAIDLYFLFNGIAADHNQIFTLSLSAVFYSVISSLQSNIVNSAKDEAHYAEYLKQNNKSDAVPKTESTISVAKGFIPGYGVFMSLKGKKYSKDKTDKNLIARLKPYI